MALNVRTSGGWSALWGAGMLAVFVGERVLGVGSGRTVGVALGLSLVIASLAGRGLRVARATSDWKRVERSLLALCALGVLALALYFAQSDLVRPGGKPLDATSPRLAGVLAALWPALFAAAAFGLALAELAYASAGRSARLESRRMRDAMWSGVAMALAVTFAFALAYVAAERDVKLDLSYFRTARPGESTRKIVRGLSDSLQASLFFPPASEVREEVSGYFADLARESKHFLVAEHDHALEPTKAKELGVSGNGNVVLSRGGRKELIPVPLELLAARSELRRFDREVQKRLLAVVKSSRTAYLTTGHDERTRDRAGEGDQRATVRDLHSLLEDQGYTVRTLGPAEGLATDVPADAGVVLVLGPTKPFLPEEAAALGRYFARGGRMFLAFDPEADLGHKDILAPMGLALWTSPLANDQVFARRTNQKSDRLNLVTGSFSSHPSVGTLGRLGIRAPLVLPGAGSLEAIRDKPIDVQHDFTVHTLPATWSDELRNFEHDGAREMRKAWEVAAAVTRRKLAGTGKPEDESRAIVLADSDGLTDGVLGNPGNAYFLVDAMRWLVGDEAISGAITSEEDVPIAHTRKQDVAWFYSTIFVAPALVLGTGFLVTRRRRQRARPAKGASS